jgi:hypothetical protein
MLSLLRRVVATGPPDWTEQLDAVLVDVDALLRQFPEATP